MPVFNPSQKKVGATSHAIFRDGRRVDVTQDAVLSGGGGSSSGSGANPAIIDANGTPVLATDILASEILNLLGITPEDFSANELVALVNSSGDVTASLDGNTAVFNFSSLIADSKLASTFVKTVDGNVPNALGNVVSTIIIQNKDGSQASSGIQSIRIEGTAIGDPAIDGSTATFTVDAAPEIAGMLVDEVFANKQVDVRIAQADGTSIGEVLEVDAENGLTINDDLARNPSSTFPAESQRLVFGLGQDFIRNYETGVQYNDGDLIVHGGILYQVTQIIGAGQNSQFSDVTVEQRFSGGGASAPFNMAPSGTAVDYGTLTWDDANDQLRWDQPAANEIVAALATSGSTTQLQIQLYHDMTGLSDIYSRLTVQNEFGFDATASAGQLVLRGYVKEWPATFPTGGFDVEPNSIWYDSDRLWRYADTATLAINVSNFVSNSGLANKTALADWVIVGDTIEDTNHVTLGTTPPADPEAGDAFIDTDNAREFTWDGNVWFQTGGPGTEATEVAEDPIITLTNGWTIRAVNEGLAILNGTDARMLLTTAGAVQFSGDVTGTDTVTYTPPQDANAIVQLTNNWQIVSANEGLTLTNNGTGLAQLTTLGAFSVTAAVTQNVGTISYTVS